MNEITVHELKNLIDNNDVFQLIDVREPHEFDICEMGGELIPMNDVVDNLDKISKTKKVIVHCRSGARSGAICKLLTEKGYTNVHNLKGGILAWADEIDASLTKY